MKQISFSEGIIGCLFNKLFTLSLLKVAYRYSQSWKQEIRKCIFGIIWSLKNIRKERTIVVTPVSCMEQIMSRLISLVEDHKTPPLVCFLESQRKYHGSYNGFKGNLSGMCFFPLLPYVSLCMPLTTKGISEHDPYEKIQPCKLWI